ncbi:Phthiocerol/phenolphthiocerol synthesis polyketide synthase type I PpsE [Corynebacterium ciconiae DSM 44920]|uniref:type I polyketide synthase n=1 Tax=Corynebacterium ciconiae TaxID=227319 RepID=UPI00037E0586|nr:type I polyketide synthase [Corynebacterium ciconiae]WKD61530.1 Phthiocerol/phenolphthiocerol synthesis polyketide synthase type I PpsE [Corynebacterium ciconiae DSM 44920]
MTRANSAIAVVSMTCRYPGADTPAQLLGLQLDGEFGYGRRTPSRDAAASALHRHPHFVPVVGDLSHMDAFDVEALGLSESAAQSTDPQMLLAMELVGEALDLAGFTGEEEWGVTGVFSSCAESVYLHDNLSNDFDPRGGTDPVRSLELHSRNVADYLPLRIAYRYNLTGPTMSIGATCASSLVAVHQAFNSLHVHECDTAIVVGVSLKDVGAHLSGYVAVPDGPYSPSGFTHSYGSDADGTVFTQGAGVIVLRRTTDALRANQPVLGMIAGSAVTNDGRYGRASFSAPSVEGHVAAIEEALAVSGLETQDIGLLHGHGTATVLGDDVEIAAFSQAYGQRHDDDLPLCSIKAHIGHTDSAAGIASLIASIQAAATGIQPPAHTANSPHPSLARTKNLKLLSSPRTWDAAQRWAGVSALGIGGVNCHVIAGYDERCTPVQNFAAERDNVSLKPQEDPLFLLSSHTADSVRDMARCVGITLAAHPDCGPQLAGMLAVHRLQRRYRAVYSLSQLRARASDTHDDAIAEPTIVDSGNNPALLWVFPGAGVPLRGAAVGLHRAELGQAGEQEFWTHLHDLCQRFHEKTGTDCLAFLTEDIAAEQAQHEPVAPLLLLASLYAYSVSLARAAQAEGIMPDVMLGHSAGEYAAATIAGTLSVDDAVSLVCARARAMENAPEGEMLSVGLSATALEELCRDSATDASVSAAFQACDIAAINAPNAVVLSGPRRDIAVLRHAVEEAGATTRNVGIAAASHSRLIEGELAAFREVATTVGSPIGQVTMVSCLDTQVHGAGEKIEPEYWVQHLRQPVRFDAAVDTAIDALECQGYDGVLACHIGPGLGLAKMVARRPICKASLSLAPAQQNPGVTPHQLVRGHVWAAGRDSAASELVTDEGFAPQLVAEMGFSYRRTPTVKPSHSSTQTSRRSRTVQAHIPKYCLVDTPEAEDTERSYVFAYWPPEARHQAATLDPSVQWVDYGAQDHASWADLDGVVFFPTLLSTQNTAPALDRVREELMAYVELHNLWSQPSESQKGGPALLVVSHASAAVTSADSPEAHRAATIAAARVFAQEHGGIAWATVDLEEPLGTQAHPHLLARMLNRSASGGFHYALRGGVLLQRSWVSAEDNPALDAVLHQDTHTDGAATPAPALQVLVLGGTGRVGSNVCLHLVSHGHEVTVCSRTAPAAQGHQGRLAAAIAAGELRWEAADVTDESRVQEILAHEDYDVCIFAPAEIDLLTFEEMDEDGLSRVMSAKIAGLECLATAIQDSGSSPRVLVMSSAAVTIGGFGLGGYVAASAFIDTCASARGWTVIDFDRFRLGSEEENNAASEVSLRHAIDIDDALNVIDKVMREESRSDTGLHFALSAGELNARSRTLVTRRSTTPACVEQQEEAALWTTQQRAVAEVWAEVLGARDLNLDTDFFAAGGHSLLATRVLSLLQQRHGIHARLRDLLDYPTVRTFADHLDHGEHSVDKRDAHAPEPAPTEAVAYTLGTAHEPFPLTRIQHAYWVGRGDGYELGGVACQFYLEYRVQELDIARYQAAWDATVAHHPMLRAVIVESGEQCIRDRRAPTIDVHDARATSAETQRRLVERTRERVSRRVSDPAVDFPVLVEIVRTDAGDHVMIAVDVLMVDSASWLIVDSCVQHYYEHPEVALEPLPLTFEDIQRFHASQPGETAQRRRAREYWDSQLDGFPDAPAIARHPAHGAPRFTRLSGRVQGHALAELRQRAQQAGVSLTSLLLSAYAYVLHDYAGQEDIAVSVTHFDRRSALPAEWAEQVDSVVGEFSSMLLLRSHADAGEALQDDRLRAINRELFDALDHRAMSGVEVLHALSRARGHVVSVPVVFTSMVDFEQDHDHSWLGEYVTGISQTPQVWLDHQAFFHRGELVLQWDVADVVDIDEAEIFFEKYLRILGGTTDITAQQAQDGQQHNQDRLESSSSKNTAADEPTSSVAEEEQLSGDATDLVAVVRQAWADLVGVPAESIQRDSTLLDIGGDSLLAVRIANTLKSQLGCTLPAPLMRADVTVNEVVDKLAQLLAPSPAEHPEGQASIELKRADPQQRFPLMSLQQAYFVGQTQALDVSYPTAHVYTDVPLWNMQINDPAEVTRILRSACRRVAVAHPMLRVSIDEDSLQYFRPTSADVIDSCVEVRVVDMRGLTAPEELEAALQRHRHTMTHQGPNPVNGGATAIVGALLLPGGHGRFLVSSSLLVLDGWSASLFDRALLKALCSEEPLPELDITFADYALSVQEYEQDAVDTDRQWWSERLPTLPAPPVLNPADAPATVTNSAGSMLMLERRISAETWSRICQRARREGVTATTAAMTAFALALAECTHRGAMLLNTLQHNRHGIHPDVMDLMGPFSRTALVSLELGRNDSSGAQPTIREVARSIAAQSGECLSHNLISAVDISRMLLKDMGRARSVAPIVFQSTLGMDAALGGDLSTNAGPLGTIDISEYFQQVRTPQVELELRCFELYGECVLSMAALPERFGDVPSLILDQVYELLLELGSESAWHKTVEIPQERMALSDYLTAGENENSHNSPQKHVREISAELERCIERLWNELVPIASEEHFFRGGGDSLLAVQLIQRLCSTGLECVDSRRLSMAEVAPEFFAHPTREGLAQAYISAAVQGEGGTSDGDESAADSHKASTESARVKEIDIASVVRDCCLHLTRGEGRPIFFIHPSGGDALCYLELARRLETDRPCVAIMDPEIAGHDVLGASIDEMVDLYYSLIKEISPDGPYTIGGWSMGGTLAHEIACALRKQGDSVDLVWMLDSNSPERIIDILKQGEALSLSEEERQECSDNRMMLRQLRSIEAYLGLDGDSGPDSDVDTLCEKLEAHGVDVSPKALQVRNDIFSRHIHALYDHHAHPLDQEVAVLLVRADQRSPRNSGEGMGVDDCTEEHLGWDSWIDGPFEVHGVPAHHYSILRQPQVVRVATLLSQALRNHTTGIHTTGRSRCSRAAAAEEGDKPP